MHSTKSGPGDADVLTPARAVRQLTAAQRRYLARLPVMGFNVMRIEGCRLATVRRFDSLGLIKRGDHGLHDARLTTLGRQARAMIVSAAG